MSLFISLLCWAQGRVADLDGDRDRGDVPGWVMITIMTAGLVVVLWGVADTQLRQILQTALTSVTGPGG